MTDVIGKLWGFCHVLRHDGINYGDYIEQLTYLLFLKLADERGVDIPKKYNWTSLKSRSGTDLLNHYTDALRTLGKEKGILGEIFAGALPTFREPVNLKRLIELVDGEEWSELDVDLKANVYEGLLQKYAAEQKGAGQYFTPRELIRSIVRCVKPDIRTAKDYTIHDPACGTAGFLIAAYEWNLQQTKEGAALSVADRERLQHRTFSGAEIVLETKRLALMNLYLHEVETQIAYVDSIKDPPSSQRYSCILANPPFGTKGAGEIPERADFTVPTANKQLNFVQHILTILKPGGRAAVVLPDNVLFEENAGREIRKILMEDCDLHTVLRLPVGTFTPYSTGVKANVIFFTKGHPTEEVWIYDARTNVEKITKGKPLTPSRFAEFEAAYGADPNGRPKGGRKETERFHRFTRQQLIDRDDGLDIFWLKDESTDNPEDLPDPEDIADEILTHLQTARDSVEEVVALLNNGTRGKK